MVNNDIKQYLNQIAGYFASINDLVDFYNQDHINAKFLSGRKIDMWDDQTLEEFFNRLSEAGIIDIRYLEDDPDKIFTVQNISTDYGTIFCLKIAYANTDHFSIEGLTSKGYLKYKLYPKSTNALVIFSESIMNPNDAITAARIEELLGDMGLATEGYVDQEVTSQLADALSSYVKISGNQNIGGQKTFTAKTTFAAETNFAGTAQFNGTIKNKNMVGGVINMHPEGDLTNMAYFMNDLTGMLSMGGTCTCTRTDKDGNVLGEPLSEYNRKQWFNGTTSYGNLVGGGK